jgi:hypothetical protein
MGQMEKVFLLTGIGMSDKVKTHFHKRSSRAEEGLAL